jgi:hypothetical protein
MLRTKAARGSSTRRRACLLLGRGVVKEFTLQIAQLRNNGYQIRAPQPGYISLAPAGCGSMADSSAERAAKRAKIDEHESADALLSAAQFSPEVEVQPAFEPGCKSLEQAAWRQHAACMQPYMTKQPNDSKSAHTALQAIWTHASYVHHVVMRECTVCRHEGVHML